MYEKILKTIQAADTINIIHTSQMMLSMGSAKYNAQLDTKCNHKEFEEIHSNALASRCPTRR